MKPKSLFQLSDEVSLQLEKNTRERKELEEKKIILENERIRLNSFIEKLQEIADLKNLEEYFIDKMGIGFKVFVTGKFELKDSSDPKRQLIKSPVQFGYLESLIHISKQKRAVLKYALDKIEKKGNIKIKIIKDEDCAKRECPHCSYKEAFVYASIYWNYCCSGRKFDIVLDTLCPNCLRRSESSFAFGDYKK